MNVLLFSTDPVALDSVFCQLIDFNPLYVPYLKIGQESGLGTCNPAEIEVSGDNLKKFIRTDFKIKRRPIQKLTLAQNLPHFIKNIIISKPIIDYRLCTNCGSCVLQCPIPEKAVNWKTGKKKEKPRYDYSRCIRCYCCQEICPEKAISVKTPFLGKIIFR
jgi:Pyruvate/2-oxoacid:ferredoxin oxidoreductase delta subunit